jgi:hypothetical protein
MVTLFIGGLLPHIRVYLIGMHGGPPVKVPLYAATNALVSDDGRGRSAKRRGAEYVEQ